MSLSCRAVMDDLWGRLNSPQCAVAGESSGSVLHAALLSVCKRPFVSSRTTKTLLVSIVLRHRFGASSTVRGAHIKWEEQKQHLWYKKYDYSLTVHVFLSSFSCITVRQSAVKETEDLSSTRGRERLQASHSVTSTWFYWLHCIEPSPTTQNGTNKTKEWIFFVLQAAAGLNKACVFLVFCLLLFCQRLTKLFFLSLLNQTRHQRK